MSHDLRTSLTSILGYLQIIKENNHIITKFINKSSKITEENVDKIFDRFYTPDESRIYNNTLIITIEWSL